MERDTVPAPVVVAVDEHDTDFLDCWCAPTYHRVCDECDPVEYRGAARVYLPAPLDHPGCWKCEHGLIPVTRAQADVTVETLVVVHR